MAKPVAQVKPTGNQTVLELQNAFISTPAAKLEPKATQAEAQDLALTYMTLFGGTWDVFSQNGKWVVKRRA